MSYIDDNLEEGERVLYRARLHWSIFIVPVGAFLLAFIWFPVFPWIGVGFLIAGTLGAITATATYRTSEYALTSRRVVANINTLSRLSVDVPLTRIEQIGVRHGLIGGILNFGTIVIRDADGALQAIPRVSAPQEFRRRIGDQLTAAD